MINNVYDYGDYYDETTDYDVDKEEEMIPKVSKKMIQ